MAKMVIGTDEYDKWLSNYRKTTDIYSGCAYEACREYCRYVGSRERTPEEEEQAYLKYKRQQTREGNENVMKMIVLHKKPFYKKMEINALWKAFDEVTHLNDNMKQEIRKFL